MPRQRKPPVQLAAHRALAVLLIHMQKKFVSNLAKTTAPRLIRAQKRLIRACAEKDVPLVIVEYARRGPTIEALQEEIKKVPRVHRIKGRHDDGFQDSALHETLQTLGATELLLMGINASSCVLDTATTAIDIHMYKVVTVGELLADWKGHADFRKSFFLYRDMGAEFHSRLELT
ncbi:MAG: hypothetical protein JWL87_646 [Candidatus Adlerbacteria bacterium]|nr:hypothetical protein [Candidatus Adlerbacteria bacterium]